MDDRLDIHVSGPSGSPPFREVGERIEANFQGQMHPGQPAYYPGVVTKVSFTDQSQQSCTYDIAYDDGDTETQVNPALVRARSRSSKRKRLGEEGLRESAGATSQRVVVPGVAHVTAAIAHLVAECRVALGVSPPREPACFVIESVGRERAHEVMFFDVTDDCPPVPTLRLLRHTLDTLWRLLPGSLLKEPVKLAYIDGLIAQPGPPHMEAVILLAGLISNAVDWPQSHSLHPPMVSHTLERIGGAQFDAANHGLGRGALGRSCAGCSVVCTDLAAFSRHTLFDMPLCSACATLYDATDWRPAGAATDFSCRVCAQPGELTLLEPPCANCGLTVCGTIRREFA